MYSLELHFFVLRTIFLSALRFQLWEWISGDSIFIIKVQEMLSTMACGKKQHCTLSQVHVKFWSAEWVSKHDNLLCLPYNSQVNVIVNVEMCSYLCVNFIVKRLLLLPHSHLVIISNVLHLRFRFFFITTSITLTWVFPSFLHTSGPSCTSSC